MGIELFITRKGATESEYYCVTGSNGWETIWLPAAKELGLDLIPTLGDGTFCQLPPDELPAMISQLSRLREWMATRDYDTYVDHLDDIIPALATVRLGEDHVLFG